jgi:hypothetical protein
MTTAAPEGLMQYLPAGKPPTINFPNESVIVHDEALPRKALTLTLI